MLKDYVDHPIMSKLGDAAKILNPLTVPSKWYNLLIEMTIHLQML